MDVSRLVTSYRDDGLNMYRNDYDYNSPGDNFRTEFHLDRRPKRLGLRTLFEVYNWVYRKLRYPFGRTFRHRQVLAKRARAGTGAKYTSSPLGSVSRAFSTGSCVLLIVSLLQAILRPSYTHPPERYRLLQEKIETSGSSGRGNVHGEKIFIAANIVNEDLIQGAWGQSLLTLIHLLGDENVFVSIYENDSGPGTQKALQDFGRKLSCPASVVTGDHIPLSVFPTVQLPNGDERVQRLTYLAEVRNRLLRPLDPTYANHQAVGFKSVASHRFDKILFLNDVYFSPLEAVQLLFSTNAGSGRAQYQAACAMDFVQLFKVYDTFVVRDTDGYQMSLQYYPWFTHLGSATSRGDALRQSDAVRVRSCWGGMAAFNATLFQGRVPDHARPQTATSNKYSIGLPGLPLQFRSGGEPFWEAAECCLIFADIEDAMGVDSRNHDTGVYLNPYISTAYSLWTWKWVRAIRRFERVFQYYQYIWSLIKSPENNPRRSHRPGQTVEEVVWIDSRPQYTTGADDVSNTKRNLAQTASSGGHFSLIRRKAPVGGFCGQRRLFVMKGDIAKANANHAGKNWEKVTVPRMKYK